jgi:hypothetical protein
MWGHPISGKPLPLAKGMFASPQKVPTPYGIYALGVDRRLVSGHTGLYDMPGLGLNYRMGKCKRLSAGCRCAVSRTTWRVVGELLPCNVVSGIAGACFWTP